MTSIKVSKTEALNELWRRGSLSFLLDKNQKDLYSLFYSSESKINTWLLARRCLAEGTLIKTPNGLVKIEDLKIGDQVFGYNKDGSIGLTNVIDTINTGKQEVVDFTTGTRILETCTKEHVWLTQNEYDDKYVERPTKEIGKANKIVRRFVDLQELKGNNEPHAYAIGALLGDGCSMQGVNKIFISSENDLIPKKVAKIIKAPYVYRNSLNNYNWTISNEEKRERGKHSLSGKRVKCNYYDQWCKDRYAHQKIAPLDIIKTWNPDSQLAFLAGIIDTDGSFYVSPDNCLTYRIGMQALSVIEACQYIIHNLFQHKAGIGIDNRIKYKNSPVYNISIKNNLIVKKILKALDSHLVTPRKKWKDEYEDFNENNTNPTRVGVKIKNPRVMQTYDIAVDNETNLYLTANGLVTHNCGKSYCLVVLAIESCLKKPNSIVKFVAPTKLQIATILRPLFRKILESCPEELQPEFRTKEYTYFFKNGSEIQLAGSDSGHIEKLRGGDADICIVDEAGDVDCLKNAVYSVLLPTTLTTRGKVIISGTPPKYYEHDFIHFIEKAELENALIRRTIHDNPRLTKKDIDDLLKELGGENTSAAQRELFCIIAKDENLSVIPEFNKALREEIVKESQVPPYFDCYVGMDLGFQDLTFLVFGYYDFLSDKVIIQNEICYDFKQKDTNLKKLTKLINEMENSLWFNKITNELKAPSLRVSDLNPIVTNEIYAHSKEQGIFPPLYFTIPRKDEKQAAINNLRLMLANKKIIIDPKCKNLIRHLENVRWKSLTNKNDFARSADDGHYDGVDALIYMTRMISYTKNPYPPGYTYTNKSSVDSYMLDRYGNKNTTSNQIDAFKKIFGIKGK